MARRTPSTESRYYFNEYRHFPIEKLFIPILIGAVLVGLYFVVKMVMRSQGPAAAAEKIMFALQTENPRDLAYYINFTEDEDRRLDFGGGIEMYGKQIIEELKRRGYQVIAYEVKESPVQNNRSTVPIAVRVRALKDGSEATANIQLPLEFTGGRWRYTTADMRRALGLSPEW
ncbi:MAG: hypothetical protein HRF45_02845 [Fimbriimonadia bacterium]|jgi:hypothetical protein